MSSPAGPRTGRPPTRCDRGVVAAPHYLASSAGAAILRRGGSAVDAVIATNAVLAVVYPHMCGLGGDGFWLIHDGETLTGLNASGPAAAAGATREAYRSQGHAQIPSRGGAAVVTVPGAVDGWRLAHERYGRLPWDDLFDDAVHYARAGVPVSRSLAESLSAGAPMLRRDAEAARVLLPRDHALRDGERLPLPDLAESLDALRRHGPRHLYDGDLGVRLAAGAGTVGSPLTPEDLAAYQAEWVSPLSITYRGLGVHTVPPNSQGIAALQILGTVEGFDVASWGDASFEHVHHIVEATKQAFADRDRYVSDPKFADVPVQRLLSREHLSDRRRAIDADAVLPTEDGDPGGDTAAFSAVDGDGLAVSAIQSLYQGFGAGVIPAGTGIVLHNRGSYFSMDDDHVNRLEPGKRTMHTLIPAMVTRDGQPWLVYSTMGGEGQAQTHAALVTRMVDFGYDVQQAIEAPRWLLGRPHVDDPTAVWLEGRIGDQTARELALVGHPVRMAADWDSAMGHAQAIRVDGDTGLLEGGADPRSDGSAAGY